MIILFPKRKGVKVATSLIFEELERSTNLSFLLGMLHFAARFGAISQDEEIALYQHITEKFREREG